MSPVDASGLREMLDDMDVRDPGATTAVAEEGVVASAVTSQKWDIHAHPVWKEALVVPGPSMAESEAYMAQTFSQVPEEELIDRIEDIEQCFGTHISSMQQSCAALEKLSTPWSAQVLQTLNQAPLDKDIAQVWYQLTHAATRWSYHDVLRAEYKANLVRTHPHLAQLVTERYCVAAYSSISTAQRSRRVFQVGLEFGVDSRASSDGEQRKSQRLS